MDKMTIGEMKGVWAILFRIFILAVPMMVGYGAWSHGKVMKNEKDIAILTAFMNQGDRFTQADGLRLKMEMADLLLLQDAKYVGKLDKMTDQLNEIRVLLAQHMGDMKIPKP